MASHWDHTFLYLLTNPYICSLISMLLASFSKTQQTLLTWDEKMCLSLDLEGCCQSSISHPVSHEPCCISSQPNTIFAHLSQFSLLPTWTAPPWLPFQRTWAASPYLRLHISDQSAKLHNAVVSPPPWGKPSQPCTCPWVACQPLAKVICKG